MEDNIRWERLRPIMKGDKINFKEESGRIWNGYYMNDTPLIYSVKVITVKVPLTFNASINVDVNREYISRDWTTEANNKEATISLK